jgi:hypothetical protein
MGKRFGGWSTDTPQEKWGRLRELTYRRKNGPVVISNVMDKVSDEMPDADEEPSTHEDK